MPGQGLGAGIAGLAAWAPGVFEAQQWQAWAQGRCQWNPAAPAPQAQSVDPLLRRRLSPLARATLAVGERLLGADQSARLVFASRHGDLRRTADLLQALAEDEPLSPTSFSLSVHNALPGLWSIARHDLSPSVAIAAGDESFAWGLVETLSQATVHPESRVLLLYADEPMVGPYACFESLSGPPLVLGVLVQAQGDERLDLRWSPAAGECREPAALAFLRSWYGAQARGTWQAEQRQWNWIRHARH